MAASEGWNVSRIRAIFSEDDAEAISGIPLLTHWCSDTLIWHYNKDDDYLVKSCYWLAEFLAFYPGSFDASSISDWWRFLWKLHLPSKIKLFI
ncbi:hypothetical protein ACOSP7_026598 [Xanthoceras sorbifolium]